MTNTKSGGTFRKILSGLLLLLAAIIIGASVYLNTLLPIITGYAAKNLCSAIFVSGRQQADVELVDLNFSFIKYTKNSVDQEEMSVTSRFLWGRSKAIFREGFGATLIRDIKESELRAISFPADIRAGYSRDTIVWPMGDILPETETGIDITALEVINDGIINNDTYGGMAFAFMVLHKGMPVAEGYKPGFSYQTPLLSWSMAKSVVNAMVGVMVKEEMVDIFEPVSLPAWSGDERKTITLNNLMQMQSGLRWNEDYGNRSDVTVMLHCVGDFASFAYNQPIEYEPGTHWYYSSGTTNIVSKIIRNRLDDDQIYYSFPQKELFYRIGITDAVFEPDASGTLVGSSYLYMTARDYARFALLYLQDGIFNSEQILPEGWVNYSVTPSSASNGEYGSFFWLNGAGEVPSAPADTYMCIGHDGQRIFMIPSLELAVVVLGYSPNGSMNFDRLLADIISTLPEEEQ